MEENKFDPVKEFITLRDSLTRSLSKSLNLGGALRPFPLVDVFESGNLIVVQTEPMPGLVPTELIVAMENNVLEISGEIIPESSGDERNYVRRERFTGPFSREVLMPQPVVASQAEASLKANVLTIRLPKRVLEAE